MNGKNIFSTERIHFKEKVQKNSLSFSVSGPDKVPEKTAKVFFSTELKKKFFSNSGKVSDVENTQTGPNSRFPKSR